MSKVLVKDVLVFKYNDVVVAKVDAEYDISNLPENLKEHAFQIFKNTVEVTLDKQEIKDGWIDKKVKEHKFFNRLSRMWKK